MLTVFLVEFTSSGMTHVNASYAKAPNDYRIAGPYADLNFGLLEIDWGPSPTVRLTTVGLDGVVGFRHVVHPESEPTWASPLDIP